MMEFRRPTRTHELPASASNTTPVRKLVERGKCIRKTGEAEEPVFSSANNVGSHWWSAATCGSTSQPDQPDQPERPSEHAAAAATAADDDDVTTAGAAAIDDTTDNAADAANAANAADAANSANAFNAANATVPPSTPKEATEAADAAAAATATASAATASTATALPAASTAATPMAIGVGVTRQPGSAMQLPPTAAEATARAAARETARIEQQKRKAAKENKECSELRAQQHGPDSSDDDDSGGGPAARAAAAYAYARAENPATDTSGGAVAEAATASATPSSNSTKQPAKPKKAATSCSKPTPKVKPTWNHVVPVDGDGSPLVGDDGKPKYSNSTHVPLVIGLEVKAKYMAAPKPSKGCTQWANSWYKAAITSVTPTAVPPVVSVKFTDDDVLEDDVLYSSLKAYFPKPTGPPTAAPAPAP